MTDVVVERLRAALANAYQRGADETEIRTIEKAIVEIG